MALWAKYLLRRWPEDVEDRFSEEEIADFEEYMSITAARGG
jgi:hypothetical protein